MAGYVHGYATPEQQRLIEQAEHWRDRLIRDGTTLEPGARLLEVGCGVGAVLAVLGRSIRACGCSVSTSSRSSWSSPARTSSAPGSRRPWRRATQSSSLSRTRPSTTCG